MSWNDTYIFVDIIDTANIMGYQPSHALPDQKLQWISFDYKWATNSWSDYYELNRGYTYRLCIEHV